MNALRSLPIRSLLLVVLVTVSLEIMVILPSLAQERRAWIREHLRDADTALSVATMPGGINDAAARNALLQLSDAELIRERPTKGAVTNFAVPGPELFDRRVDLSKETRLQGGVRAVMALLQTENGRLLVIGNSPRRPETWLEVIVPAAHLRTTLRQFAATHVMEWAISAAVTGVLLYVALMVLLVSGQRQRVGLSGNQMSVASRERTETDLRATWWRDARLAALQAAVAKANHDLRGILSSAMLAADRLRDHTDPAVRRASGIVVSAIERSSALMRQTVDSAREGPPSLVLCNVRMQELVTDLAEATPGFKVKSDLAANIVVKADRLALFRVMSNLACNAQQAGATQLTIWAERGPAEIAILVGDDGPGLPQAVQTRLFRAGNTEGAKTSPSTSSTPRGTGLGLATVRDFMRAHGGDALLERTGPEGTVFRLVLPGGATGGP